MLVSHVLVPPAMTALLDAPDCEVQAFLAAGHVCAVMGWTEYEPIADRYRVPIVVTGFEPLDLLEGILMAVRQLEDGRHEVENQYVRAVRRSGNTAAQDVMRRVFRVTDRAWRGIGTMPASGLELAEEFAEFDAERALRRRRAAPRGAPRVHRRRHPHRRQAAHRLHGVRHALHAPHIRSARPWCPPRAPAPPSTRRAGRGRQGARHDLRDEPRHDRLDCPVPYARPSAYCSATAPADGSTAELLGGPGAARPRDRRRAGPAGGRRTASRSTPNSWSVRTVSS